MLSALPVLAMATYMVASNAPHIELSDMGSNWSATVDRSPADPAIGQASSADTTATLEAAPTVPEIDWRKVTIKEGDSFYSVMRGLGYPPALVAEVTALGRDAKLLTQVKPGDVISIGAENQEWKALEYRPNPLTTLKIGRDDGALSIDKEVRAPEIKPAFSQATVDSSMYLAALRAGLPDKLIMELAEIFGWDIDFTMDVQVGDRFALVYEDQVVDGKSVGQGDILAAEFVNRDRILRAIRYTDGKGNTAYYTPQGESMRQAFSRNPLPITKVTSRFNPRRLHPVFRTVRPHRGVDYGAPSGTPVMATGDGRVAFKGQKGGYGNVIILQHGQISTLYGHLKGFSRSLRTGGRVQQGETIGFVGRTGLATGPHLHYEFRVNGAHKDPLKVPIPHADPVPKGEMVAFKERASSLLAQLEGFRNTQLARLRD